MSRLAAMLLIAALAVSACVGATATPTAAPGSRAIPSSSASPSSASSPTATFQGDCCAPPSRPPYAMVTARPSRDAAPPPPGPTFRPAASPTPADTESQDGIAQLQETVPAGGSVSVPISFEGSKWGGLMVRTKSKDVTAKFGGQTLKATNMTSSSGPLWLLSINLDKAADGTLVIRNAGAGPEPIEGSVMIMTRRHLTIVPSMRYPKVGQTISFDVNLTEATETDEVTAELIAAPGQTPTPLEVSKVGTGRWTGRATVTTTGEVYLIAMTKASPRFRLGQTFVTVAAGNVTLSSSFGETLVDENRNGLADKLVITPTITLAAAGKYTARARLVDADGVEVGNAATGELDLGAGAQPLNLEFDGATIAKAGRWGPYRIVDLTVVADDPFSVEIDSAELGQTQPYDYLQFEHERVAFDYTTLTSKAVDTDGDGVFEQLEVSGFVTVEVAGQYEINTGLYAQDPWDHVALAYATVQLTAGRNAFTLAFKGSEIASAGRNGPYAVSGLGCYPLPETGFDIGDIGPLIALTTDAYKAAQFGG